jgi:hypothetical protein
VRQRERAEVGHEQSRKPSHNRRQKGNAK